MAVIIILFYLFFILRLGTLVYSIRNEKRLKGIGIGLLTKAWTTMLVLLPLYAVVMVVRIVQEERVMRQNFVGF